MSFFLFHDDISFEITNKFIFWIFNWFPTFYW